jgi:hypothetical protein
MSIAISGELPSTISHTSKLIAVSAVGTCLFIFGALNYLFRRSHRGIQSVYFDAQDFRTYENGGGRELPQSASNGTFAPLLQHYIGITQLLITVAAASIAFGGGQNQSFSIHFAKICLACSILFGVLFSATMLYRYDEYMQDVRSYTRFWYTTVESLGFSCLACFFLGYFVWAIGI